MSQSEDKEANHSLDTVPEDGSASARLAPASQRTETAPISFKEPFGMAAKDGQDGSISPLHSPELRRLSANTRRTSSIQFSTSRAEDTIRRESIAAGKMPPTDEARQLSIGERKPSEGGRRLPSPPPKSTYQRGVSFDTFDNRDATEFSLTLQYKHRSHQRTRRSRTFLCGTDQNEYSELALEWLLDELVDDGDEIVCLRAVEKDSKIASDASMQQRKYRREAQKLMDWVIAKNGQEEEKAISLVLEFAVGKVQEVIQRMIQIHEPAVLVVGTRGRNLGGVQGLLSSGSVSKYCLQQSPIPVIVVRSSTKRMKKKEKRMANPSRRNYNWILKKAQGGYSMDKTNRNSIVGPLPSATDQEAAAVAKAIGVPKHFEAAPLSRVVTGRSDRTERSVSPGPASSSVIMKSPNLIPVDTPESSEEDDEEQDDEDGDEDEDDLDDGVTHPHLPKAKRRAGRARGALVDEVDPSKDPPWLAAILQSDDRKP